MYSVVLVCLGNICRSPMAEVVLRDRLAAAGLGERVRVSSAGTGGWHFGNDMDPRSRRALEAGGYAPPRHRAQQVTRATFADHDLVVAMDASTLAGLRAVAPDDASARAVRLMRSYDQRAVDDGDLDVPDPYYGGADGFAEVLAHLERASDGLVATLGARR